MARLNTPRTATGPIATESTPTGTTFEGAPGFARDPKGELFLAAVSNFNEQTFYERADDREQRIQALVEKIAPYDPDWMESLIRWLRKEGNLRTVPIMISAMSVKIRLNRNLAHNRGIVRAALGRLDEPGEYLGYWTARYGRPIPSAVKRGINDYLADGLTEFGWLKWRGKGKRGNFDLRDVLNVTHPDPSTGPKAALYAAVMAEAYGREADLRELNLPMTSARGEFLALGPREQQHMIVNGGRDYLRAAGLTHEVVAGALGKIPADVWDVLVPTMGYQALLMNLRRMGEAGISDETREAVGRRLRDPDEVARSRMYPMRFLAAYRNAPLDFAGALQEAANHTLANIPEYPGKTLVLVDRSASMNQPMSARSELTRRDAANIFGAAVAMRAESPTLIAYGSQAEQLTPKGDLLRVAESGTQNMGGTATRQAVERFYRNHDRVIVLTDEQAGGYGWGMRGADVFAKIPMKVPCYTVNLAGYRMGHAPSNQPDSRRYVFGGLTDKMFQMIEWLEVGQAAGWPWEQ